MRIVVRYAVLIPIVYAAAVVQTSLVDAIEVGRMAPDLLALAAVTWVLVARGRWSYLTAGAIGLFSDLISPGRPGAGMACFMLVAYGMTSIRTRLPRDNLFVQVAMVWPAVSALMLALTACHAALGDVALPQQPLAQALGVGLYTAGVALPVLMVVGWVREPLLRRQQQTARL